jgi:hypothetical protein
VTSYTKWDRDAYIERGERPLPRPARIARWRHYEVRRPADRAGAPPRLVSLPFRHPGPLGAKTTVRSG